MKFDITCEFLVAGTGAAGGGAVMGALMAGASDILVCEKSTEGCGGTTQNAGLGWLWVPNNRFLREMGIRQDPAEVLELLITLAEASEVGHKVDDGDLKLMKAFAYDWPKVLTDIEKKGYMNLKPEVVRSEEDAAMLEELYKRKIKSNPEAFKKIGITMEKVAKLKTLMPSYCAEHDLDKCPTGKVVSCEGKGTSGYVQNVIKTNKDKVTLKEGFQVIDLIFSDATKTKIIGAVVNDIENNKILNVKATKGVFFGTGGFSMDKKKMKKYFAADFHGSCAGEKNTGDLVDIALKHDIKLCAMDEAWVKQCVVPESESRFPGVFFHNADSYAVVNKFGKRFANERDYYQERGRRMIKNQEDMKLVFAIFDKRTSEIHAGPLLSLGGPIPFEFAQEDCILTGSTFTELKNNIQKHMDDNNVGFTLDNDFDKTLEAEIDKFNDFARNGDDKDFGRGKTASKFCWHTPRRDNKFPNKTLHPIDKSNVMALVLGLSTLDTRGGPRTTQHGQIYKNYEKKELVQGLYGSGNCVKAFAKHSYPASGVTISSAMFFGWQSAQHAFKSNAKL